MEELHVQLLSLSSCLMNIDINEGWENYTFSCFLCPVVWCTLTSMRDGRTTRSVAFSVQLFDVHWHQRGMGELHRQLLSLSSCLMYIDINEGWVNYTFSCFLCPVVWCTLTSTRDGWTTHSVAFSVLLFDVHWHQWGMGELHVQLLSLSCCLMYTDINEGWAKYTVSCSLSLSLCPVIRFPCQLPDDVAGSDEQEW